MSFQIEGARSINENAPVSNIECIIQTPERKKWVSSKESLI